MIELHVISLIVAGLFGAVVQFAVTVYFQPKKRRRKPALGPRSPSENLAAKAEAAGKK